MKSPLEDHSLLQALQDFVLPQVQRRGMAKVLVAPPQWKREMALPEGMTVARRPLRGARVPKRGRRPYGAAAVIEAEWPEDEMYSLRTPKLCFVVTGAASFRIADYVVHCKSGHGVLLPSGTPISTDNSHFDEGRKPPNRCETLMLLPYQGGLLCWLSRSWHDRQDDQKYVVEETVSVPQSRVSFYLNGLVAEATRHDLHRRAVCDSLLNIALALLDREIQQLPVFHTGELHAAANPMEAGRKEYSIAQAQEYIRHNLREALSIDKVARSVCMSRTVFTEQFRAQSGKSFAQYVTDLRFEEAEKILQGTDLAVQHVGALVGLKACRMRTLFQERKGISPTQFRRDSRREYSHPQ